MLALFVILSVLAPQSLCICVRDERYPMSTCSSIIIVPESDIVNNSVTLIIELQSHFESECQNETTLDARSEIDGTLLRTILYENNTLKIRIPNQIREGRHTISLSYTHSGCGKAVTLSHEIHVHVLDNPELVHESEDPHIFKCKIVAYLPTLLVEFMKDSEAIGYCGPFSSPVQHKEHTTVYYNSTLSTCILEIDTQSISANGVYYCSLILPYPHENRFLKTYSSRVEIKQSDLESKNSNLELRIGLGVGLSVVFLCILVTVIIGILYYCVCVRNQTEEVLQGPENGDNQDDHVRVNSYHLVDSNEIND